MGSLLFIVALVLVLVDITIRNDSSILSKEASRIDKAVLNSLDGSRQLRTDNMAVQGLWDKIVRCTTGTLCDSYDDNYVAMPIEAGKESELIVNIARATGYSRVALENTQDCHFGQSTDICNGVLFHDKFRLNIYITSQPGLSSKDIAPRVWRNVHLNLTSN
jgi:hypothetical protein